MTALRGNDDIVAALVDYDWLDVARLGYHNYHPLKLMYFYHNKEVTANGNSYIALRAQTCNESIVRLSDDEPRFETFNSASKLKVFSHRARGSQVQEGVEVVSFGLGSVELSRGRTHTRESVLTNVKIRRTPLGKNDVEALFYRFVSESRGWRTLTTSLVEREHNTRPEISIHIAPKDAMVFAVITENIWAEKTVDTELDNRGKRGGAAGVSSIGKFVSSVVGRKKEFNTRETTGVVALQYQYFRVDYEFKDRLTCAINVSSGIQFVNSLDRVEKKFGKQPDHVVVNFEELGIGHMSDGMVIVRIRQEHHNNEISSLCEEIKKKLASHREAAQLPENVNIPDRQNAESPRSRVGLILLCLFFVVFLVFLYLTYQTRILLAEQAGQLAEQADQLAEQADQLAELADQTRILFAEQAGQLYETGIALCDLRLFGKKECKLKLQRIHVSSLKTRSAGVKSQCRRCTGTSSAKENCSVFLCLLFSALSFLYLCWNEWGDTAAASVPRQTGPREPTVTRWLQAQLESQDLALVMTNPLFCFDGRLKSFLACKRITLGGISEVPFDRRAALQALLDMLESAHKSRSPASKESSRDSETVLSVDETVVASNVYSPQRPL